MELWQRIDSSPFDEARDLLRTACGSARWVERMLARRPFGTRDAALSAAREDWFALSNADWREAFGHHPKIGDREGLKRRFATTRHLTAEEQAGTNSATEAVLTALAAANRAYENRFGYIFIVSAAGRSADEMLAALEERLENDPHIEIRIAAEEQAKITRLRLGGTSAAEASSG
jgi:2-oxo-4-hydroxy-4-carboxy-5-ureidoimidazoline decarboxylase